MKTVQAHMRSDAGFSLIETLIAVSILSVVTLSGMLIMSNYMKGSEALGHTATRVQTLSSLRATLSDDLRHVIARPVDRSGARFYLKSDIADDQPFLSFMRTASSLSRSLADHIAVERVEYWHRDGALIRRAYLRPDGVEDTPYREQILAHDIAALNTQAYAGGRWVDAYTVHAEQGAGQHRNLPSMLDITVTLPVPSGQENIAYPNRFRVGGVS